MRAILYLAVALVTATQASAQDIDPFAAAERDADARAFHALRDDALESVTRTYFALGCKVLPNETSAAILAHSAVMPVYDSFRTYHQIDSDLSGKTSAAKQAGLDRAREGCLYWTDHMDEAVGIRRQALFALQHPY